MKMKNLMTNKSYFYVIPVDFLLNFGKELKIDK
jgi:hypothetical protein